MAIKNLVALQHNHFWRLLRYSDSHHGNFQRKAHDYLRPNRLHRGQHPSAGQLGCQLRESSVSDKIHEQRSPMVRVSGSAGWNHLQVQVFDQRLGW